MLHYDEFCLVPFISCRAIMCKETKVKMVSKYAPLVNWPLVDIKKLDVVFFSTIKGLNGSSLDPKYDLENQRIIVEECIAMFGGARNFKIKSLDVKLDYEACME